MLYEVVNKYVRSNECTPPPPRRHFISNEANILLQKKQKLSSAHAAFIPVCSNVHLKIIIALVLFIYDFMYEFVDNIAALFLLYLS